jgi:Na+/melibiose symporter-like transporter
MKWHNYLVINSYWLGINIASAVLVPVLLPYLVVLFMPPELKNTNLAIIRVVGLSVAMLIQPLAGMLSDRNTSRWGRRRPYIFTGALLNVVFLAVMGASTLFGLYGSGGFFERSLGVSTAFFVLALGYVLLQFSSNIGHGALQGLIPDLVPENQRGKASGVKAVLELLPVFLVVFIGPLVDAGKIWLVVGIIMLGFVATMLVTVFGVHEKPLEEKPKDSLKEPVLRIAALTAIFVLVSQLAVVLVKAAGSSLSLRGVDVPVQVVLVGLAGLLAMLRKPKRIK